jgi:uncharacterized RDD family membrane protein YckC
MVRASFGKRFLAALIDGVIIGLPATIVAIALGGGALVQALLTAVGICYYVYFEGGKGATLGKQAMGLRVITTAGMSPIGYGTAAVRYVGRIISGVALGLGYLWMLWDEDKQTWHDKMASTYVVEV